METKKKSVSTVAEHPNGSNLLIKAICSCSIVNMIDNREKINVDYEQFIIAGIGEFSGIDVKLGQSVMVNTRSSMNIDWQRVTIKTNKATYAQISTLIREIAVEDKEIYAKKIKAQEKVKFVEYYIIPDSFIIAHYDDEFAANENQLNAFTNIDVPSTKV